jgi:predicted CXXCH cytochrome family protein
MRMKVKSIAVIVLLGMAVIAGGNAAARGQAAAAAGAAPPAARPNGPVEPGSCVTADCHASVKRSKVLHGPVNVNACDACHTLTDAATHTYTLTRNRNELCGFCHQLEQPAGATVHAPVRTGDCLSCHDPHGGATRSFVRDTDLLGTCNQCHADIIAQKKVVHGPVAAGACTSCHKPHASEHAHLLTTPPGRELCFSCHAEMKTRMAAVQFQHKAVEQDCGACHDPHASDHAMQIRQEPLALCASCHEPVKKVATGSAHRHSVVTDGEACLNCHTAHGSDLASLMKREPVKVCMSCHDKPLGQGDGTVAAVADVLKPEAVKHGPIRDGNCGGCHNTHGSELPRLLTRTYPDAFYQSFALEKYELCFSCHDKQLVLAEKTTGLTGFRNGETNLHFVHINKTEKGRNCRACHETHASTNELHVRDSVPYGKWQMPIAFEKTDTGGSCTPGCHKRYAYDRGATGAMDRNGKK